MVFRFKYFDRRARTRLSFSLLSSLFDDFYTKPQSDHPSLSKHDQVTAIAFLAQRPPNSHTLGADLAVSGVFTYPTFSPNTS